MTPTASAIIAILSIFVTAGGVWLQYRNTKRQNQTQAHLASVEDRKVDQEAYDKAVHYYEGIVSRLSEQVASLNTQLDQVYTQLATERSVSNTLRTDMWGLQDRVRDLQRTIDELQATIEDLRHRPEDIHTP